MQGLLITLLVVVGALSTCWGKELYDFKIEDIQGNLIDMKDYKGKTLLIVNVASQCGQTDAHYKSLKRLYDILSGPNNDQFEVLAFPSNDFGEQEPWEHKEIEEFVRSHFKAEFPLFKKVKIGGDSSEPLWKYIIETSKISPAWNFQKYLFNSKGEFVKSWDSNTSVESIFDIVKSTIDNPSGSASASATASKDGNKDQKSEL